MLLPDRLQPHRRVRLRCGGGHQHAGAAVLLCLHGYRAGSNLPPAGGTSAAVRRRCRVHCRSPGSWPGSRWTRRGLIPAGRSCAVDSKLLRCARSALLPCISTTAPPTTGTPARPARLLYSLYSRLLASHLGRVAVLAATAALLAAGAAGWASIRQVFHP